MRRASRPAVGVRLAVALSVAGGLSCEWILGPGNRPPEAVGTIAQLEVQVDSVVELDLAAYFADPDGDSLGYSVWSSDPTRALASVRASTLTVSGVAAGTAAVTVTATDPEGLTAQQAFLVTVPNRAPVAVGTIADLEVRVDSVAGVAVAAHFADPDGDALTFAAATSDPMRVAVAMSGDTVIVEGVAKGTAAVTVTATDPEGLTAELSFGVTVPNRAPAAVGTIADLEVRADSVAMVGVGAHFEDPDGDALTYAASSSDAARVAAAAAGDTVTVEAVAKGTATVTVTATDTEGLTAELSFGVTVPNRAPAAVGAIADLEVRVDSVVEVGVGAHFEDPDGDALTYAASSSDPARAAVAVAGDAVLVEGVAKGSAMVTVTATDTEGLSAQQSFGVTVPNRAPDAVGAIADLEVRVDSAAKIAVAARFEDPDGDALTYAASSSDPARAAVAVAGDLVTVAGVAKGSVTVTVTATDTEGLTAEQTFGVTVPNRAPAAAGTIADLEVRVDSVAEVAVGRHFADPDGDALTYAAWSSDPARVAVAMAGDLVTVAGVAKGSVVVTVTATDTEGLTAEQAFGVTVPNRAPVAAAAIADLEVRVDGVAEVAVGGHFADPDGDVLAYAAVSSDPTRVAASVAGDLVTVAGVAKGSAMVTVTATDTEGLTAQQTFRVTVPNRGPEVVRTIADLVVRVDSVAEIAVGAHFADPDGDALTYGASSSDPARAAVAVAGDLVTVAGVAKGSAMVTVTATDTEGLTAEHTFGVTVPNQAPETVRTFADLEVRVDSVAEIAVAAHFADPDGDALTYAASSSDPARVAAAVAGDLATVTGVAKGTAMVTVTATDTEGLTAEQRFRVTVPSRAPVAVGTIADLEVRVDSVVEIGVAAHFADPDGDSLTYAASSSDPARVAAAAAGDLVTVAGVAKGTAAVTVTATDTQGLTAQQRFGVTVPNRAPEALDPIPDREVKTGADVSVDAAFHFNDPDGDDLGYSAASSRTDVAGVDVVASVVVVTGRSVGSTTITVTARDDGDLAAEQRFTVRVGPPNRPPLPVGTIADVTALVDTETSVAAEPYFTDPDDDPLSLSATSSDPDVAGVRMVRGTVIVRGESPGTSTVTVTARDPEGLSATQRFDVAVRESNQAPLPVGTIPDHAVPLGEETTLDAQPYFDDPDGDPLDYSATSSNGTIATVTVSGSLVEMTGHEDGEVTITVEVEDPWGLTATQRFVATVQDIANRAPFVSAGIGDIADAAPGSEHRAVLTDVFSDPDGDPLTYTASSTNTGVASPSISADTVVVNAIAQGSATISVTATDPEGLSATDQFEVAVGTERFQLALGFTSDVTSSQRARIRSARATWEAALRDTELADVQMPSTIQCLNLVANNVGTVDDHLSLAHVGPIDGRGSILARATYCYTRSGDGTIIVSAMVFDEADMGWSLGGDNLVAVAFHELAHGLGFHDSYFSDRGVLNTGDDPHFTGTQAIAAFDAAGGTGYTGAKVPISSPDHSHWRESVFADEVMTPYFNNGQPNPISAITLRAMADLGYTVDVSVADNYQLDLTSPSAAGGEGAQAFDLGGDVVRGPVVVVDAGGGVVRVIPAPPGSVVPSLPRREVRIEARRPGSGSGGTGGSSETSRRPGNGPGP